MAATTDDVRSAVHRLAGSLLEDVERIAGRSVARMQELLPSYAKVPADALLPVTLTNTRNLLEAVRDPDADADPTSADRHFRQSGATRLDQGITADEMLQAWRIGLEVVREEAHPVAERLQLTEAVLLEFIEETLLWGDVGMRVSASAHREGERRELERLAAEQAALRRVAEVVARHAPAEQVLAVVTEELSRLLGVSMVRTVRFEPDGSATVLAAHGLADDRLTGGANFPIPDGSVIERVFRTGRPARVDDFAEVEGPIGVILREQGAGAGVAGPIVVDGRLWGAMAVGAPNAETLPPGSEERLVRFAELVSTAIANIESRKKVEQLVAEQSALRRVAELVARHAPPERLFALVTDELNRLLHATHVAIARREPDGTAMVLAIRGPASEAFPPGTSVPLEGGSSIEQVFRTGRPAHVENYDNVRGQLGRVMREVGAGWSAAGPIVVDGRLWGAMVVNSTTEAYPAGAEQRVAQFTELVSTAISNIESRAKVERLAAEQSALRRVATLVAREYSPEDLFATLAEEVGVLLGVDASAILRYEPDSAATVVAGWSDGAITIPLGRRFPLAGENLAGQVLGTGKAHRKDDYDGAVGPIAATVRELGIRAAVASPIVVEGVPWGVVAVLSRDPGSLPPDAEARLAEFSQVAGMAVANAKSRSDLAESRARIVRAADEARRRFERDLHDGAQQRLVSLGLELSTAGAIVPPELGELRGRLARVKIRLNDVLDDLRELSRGLHPAVLSEDGLRAALLSLALRSAVPTELELDLGPERLEEPVEVAAYYVTSEALTNAAKHAHASRVQVRASPTAGSSSSSATMDVVARTPPAGQDSPVSSTESRRSAARSTYAAVRTLGPKSTSSSPPLAKPVPGRRLVPGVARERRKRRPGERDTELGLALLTDIGTILQRRRCVSPVGAGHHVHGRIVPIGEQHDRREPVAGERQPSLGPERVAAHALSRHEQLDRAAGWSLNLESAVNQAARHRDGASEALQPVANGRLASAVSSLRLSCDQRSSAWRGWALTCSHFPRGAGSASPPTSRSVPSVTPFLPTASRGGYQTLAAPGLGVNASSNSCASTAAATSPTNPSGATPAPAAASTTANAARHSRETNVRSRSEVHSAPRWRAARASANALIPPASAHRVPTLSPLWTASPIASFVPTPNAATPASSGK